MTGATVTGPSGSPVSFSVDLGGTNPNNGDTLTVQFTLPDGSTEQVALTASSATPLPAGSFAIDPNSPANTASNLNSALNSAIGTLANTSLVAASAMAAGDNFFNTAGSAIGVPKNSQLPAPISAATQLSGPAASNAIAPGFAAGDTITVNGTTLTFVTFGRDRQPAQCHRQLPDPARQDRPDHRHVEAVDGPWRRDHDQHRRRGEPEHLELEHRGPRGARLRLLADHGDAAAPARRRLAGELGHDAGERLGQHGQMVHRQ